MTSTTLFLDLRTLIVVHVLIAVLFGCMLVVFSHSFRRFTGVDWVGGGLLATGLGFLLLLNREQLPYWAGVTAAGVALTLAWALVYEGIAAFRELPYRSRTIGPLAIILVSATSIYYGYVSPDLQLRLISFNLIQMIMAAAVVQVTLTRTPRSGLRLGQLLIAVSVAIMACQFAVSAAMTILTERPESLFGAGGLGRIAFLWALLTTISVSCGMLWLAVGRMEGELRHQLRTDPLTGAFNRRAMDEISAGELSRSQSTGKPIAVLIADLDDFKAVNDQHGHQVGDDVLRQFSALLAANLRIGETLVRYGGEEFLILLPGSNRDEAAATAEKLRALIEAQIFMVAELELRLKASFGVAALRGSDDDWSHLLRRADAALYVAKNSGRNRVSCSWVGLEPGVSPAAG